MKRRVYTNKMEQVKHETKVVMIDMAVDLGLGIAFKVITIPGVRAAVAIAKLGMDVKMFYDSIKLMKHSFEAM